MYNETYHVSNYVQSLGMNLKLCSYEIYINVLFWALLVLVFMVSYMYFLVGYLS